ncbi:hypothetical protein ACJENL_27295, partial [Escherichia coli]
KLDAADVATMQQALATLAAAEPAATAPRPSPGADGPGGPAEDVFHLHFSLGKAFEDAGDHAASSHHYAEGNRLRRALVRYDADEF